MQLRPETPALAVLQAGGVDVAVSLAAAARGHMPGQAQLWVLDHLPEPEAGQGLPTMAELCPRWGEVAVIVTSRILPGDPELEVMELGPLTDEAGAALLTAGLPAGAMAEAEARAVSAWVGGLPIALELLARSLDLGDLSLAELATLVRGAGLGVAVAPAAAAVARGLRPWPARTRLRAGRGPVKVRAAVRGQDDMGGRYGGVGGQGHPRRARVERGVLLAGRAVFCWAPGAGSPYPRAA